MTERERWVLADLAHHRAVMSYDWDADERFMLAFGFDDEDLAHRSRLRVLQSLQRRGLVRGCWGGVGHGGLDAYGVRRVRGYSLTEGGAAAAAACAA